MDDLEFRRALLADPNARTDEINDAMTDDPSKKQYADEIHHFNTKIEAALNVDVPEELASKLILRQATETETESEAQAEKTVEVVAANDGKYWQIAMAACVAFVMGLMLNVNTLFPADSMKAGEYALKYTYRNML